MRKWITAILLISFLVMPVCAMEFTAPTAPESAMPYMPEEQETFLQGLLYILKQAIFSTKPEIKNASGICLSVIALVLLLSLTGIMSKSAAGNIRLTGAVAIGVLLLGPANTMIQLGAETVTDISEYGKLLIPVMTAAIAAQGGASSSTALYAGTIFFNSLLTTVIVKLLIPALYIYLCLSVACCAIDQEMLKQIRDFVKNTMTWILKTVLYIFTGYMTITGVITGTVDSSALKAAKLAISGSVPVVGGILSDASETILVSAGVMKNAAGIYGIFATLAICLGPFLNIGVQYLLLKLTAGVCGIFDYKPTETLIKDFSSGMGLVLAATGTVCIMLLISLVCFMKGMNI
ncbi:MAG: stage III sporulation protein AE [Oscillospiraceae bacterium]|nr:stage III sporulation protein AE [Oscillospiraceae bacterium]